MHTHMHRCPLHLLRLQGVSVFVTPLRAPLPRFQAGFCLILSARLHLAGSDGSLARLLQAASPCVAACRGLRALARAVLQAGNPLPRLPVAPLPFQAITRDPSPGGLPDLPGWIRGPSRPPACPSGRPSSAPTPLRLWALEDRPRLCPTARCQAGPRLTVGAQ